MQTTPSGADHPRQFGHVRLGIGEMLDQMRGAGPVEALGGEPEIERVHLGHPKALGRVAGGRRRDGFGGVVGPEDLAIGSKEAGRLESVAAAHIEDAPVADAVEHGPVARLVQGEQGVRGHTLLGSLARQPAFGAAGHDRPLSLGRRCRTRGARRAYTTVGELAASS